MPTKIICLRKLLNTLLITSLWIGIIISFFGIVFVPRNTYVLCDDLSLQREYKKSTISVIALLTISLLGPYAQMTLTEWLKRDRSSTSSTFKRSFKRASSFFGSLGLGFIFTFFVIEILKTSVSAPRPHFLNSCMPNFTQFKDCQKNWVHVTWEMCTNPLDFSYIKLIDTMKSFPSGHAAIGIYSAVFMTMYIRSRMTASWSTLLAAWMQLMWWVWGLLCTFSRVWDGMHHWRDVISGGIFGLFMGYFTVVYLCLGFNNEQLDRVKNEDKKTNKEENYVMK